MYITSSAGPSAGVTVPFTTTTAEAGGSEPEPPFTIQPKTCESPSLMLSSDCVGVAGL